MDYKKIFNDFLKKEYGETDFKLTKISEDEKNVFGYIDSKNDFDIPVLVLNKTTNKVIDEILPPFTDDENAKIIWQSDFDADEETDYD